MIGSVLTKAYWVERGRLISFPPRSYAEVFGQGVVLSVPLVLHNTGPAPIVVPDVCLRIDKSEQQHQKRIATVDRASGPSCASSCRGAPCKGSLSRREPYGASALGNGICRRRFPVEGRRAVERFIEFQRRSGDWVPLNGPYTATAEVGLAPRRAWRRLVTSPLHTKLVDEDGRTPYIAGTDDPEWSNLVLTTVGSE